MDTRSLDNGSCRRLNDLGNPSMPCNGTPNSVTLHYNHLGRYGTLGQKDVVR